MSWIHYEKNKFPEFPHKLQRMDIDLSQITMTFIEAVQLGNQELAIAILSENPNIFVNQRDDANMTALLWSVISCRNELVQKLLQCPDIIVNDQDDFGWTPLHYASYLGKKDIVLSLLSHRKINVNIQSTTGKTPLDLAKTKEVATILKAFMSSSMNSTASSKYNPISLSAASYFSFGANIPRTEQGFSQQTISSQDDAEVSYCCGRIKKMNTSDPSVPIKGLKRTKSEKSFQKTVLCVRSSFTSKTFGGSLQIENQRIPILSTSRKVSSGVEIGDHRNCNSNPIPNANTSVKHNTNEPIQEALVRPCKSKDKLKLACLPSISIDSHSLRRGRTGLFAADANPKTTNTVSTNQEDNNAS